jgi:cytochrome c oxidase subunit 3
MAEARAPTLDRPELPELDQESISLGMWIFLASEVMFFGALFAAYIIYRNAYPQVFAEASRHLNVWIGGVNTGLLLTSSLTVALAVNAAQLGKRKLLIAFLLLTIVLGLIFLGLKGLEYSQEFEENLFPGRNFTYPGPEPEKARLFFSLYFTMTGLHALHMLAGLLTFSIIVLLAWRKKITQENYISVELAGLFWHFVDIVWIFLFPLLYLIGRA